MGEIYRATDTVLGRDVAIKVLFPARGCRSGAPRAVHARGARGRPALRRGARCHDLRRRRDRRPALHRHGVPARRVARRPARCEAARRSPRRSAGWTKSLARSTRRTRAGSCTGTSSPRTCCSTAPGTSTSPTSGSRARRGSTRTRRPAWCSVRRAISSPEQASGQRATPASDVYSLGVVARELLGTSLPQPTGQRPASRTNRYATARALTAALRDAEPPHGGDVAGARGGRRVAVAVALRRRRGARGGAARCDDRRGLARPRSRPSRVVTVPSPARDDDARRHHHPDRRSRTSTATSTRAAHGEEGEGLARAARRTAARSTRGTRRT